VLARIDQNLADAGSDKTRLLSATVYLTDIGRKAEMDAVWNAWIGTDNWPQRACVQAGLAPNTLVEITVIAARRAAGQLQHLARPGADPSQETP
jgi:enamine deaminase RidA (YjgF/YER057c/UK114 family)